MDKKTKYEKVRLGNKKIVPAHSLVVETFIEFFPPPPVGEWYYAIYGCTQIIKIVRTTRLTRYDGLEKLIVDHRDGVKKNNSIQNLRRGTKKLNNWNKLKNCLGSCG